MNMDHLSHLDAIARSDVAVLRAKEATYRGSWKAAGGRSAWFMARRNLDRLLTMMRPPEAPEGLQVEELDRELNVLPQGVHTHSSTGYYRDTLNYLMRSNRAEDIFAMIEADPSGADGTVLAVMRDARRYFTLVEAEMVARGVVVPEGWVKDKPCEMDRSPDLAAPHVCSVCGTEVTDLAKKWQVQVGDGAPENRCEAHLAPELRDQLPVGSDVILPGTPEDGGHHEAVEAAKPKEALPRYPYWEINPTFARSYLGGTLYQLLYVEWNAQRAFLTPFLTMGDCRAINAALMFQGTRPEVKKMINRIHEELYTNQGEWSILDIAKCPEGLRDQYPYLQREVNHFELVNQPTWTRDLYAWDNGGNKYTLRHDQAAWGKTP